MAKLLAHLYEPSEGRITWDDRDLADHDADSVRRSITVVFQDFMRYWLSLADNIGLHYFDMKNYGKALIQAHKAMALGFVQTELKDQLRSVGKWVEATDLPAPPDPAASKPTEQAE